MKRLLSGSRYSKNPRSDEYDEYLDIHIGGVKRAWEEILKPNFNPDWLSTQDGTLQEFLAEADSKISNHDASKYDEDEYPLYCNYFYPSPGFEKNDADFDLGWLRHQHKNGHHWQHWVLMRDEGEKEPIDIPLEYICEMLCDWSSFQYVKPGASATAWWEANKQNMVLSEPTIETIEKILSVCTES